MEEGFGLSCAEVYLRVSVQTECYGCIHAHVLLNVFRILIVRCGHASFERVTLALVKWIQLGLLKKLVLEVPRQVCHGHESIEVVDDMTTVHDLTKNVAQVLPWHFPACI